VDALLGGIGSSTGGGGHILLSGFLNNVIVDLSHVFIDGINGFERVCICMITAGGIFSCLSLLALLTMSSKVSLTWPSFLQWVSILFQLVFKFWKNCLLVIYLFFFLLADGMSGVDSDKYVLQRCLVVLIKETAPHFCKGGMNGKVLHFILGAFPWKHIKDID
jgi:hypothetical protein